MAPENLSSKVLDEFASICNDNPDTVNKNITTLLSKKYNEVTNVQENQTEM